MELKKIMASFAATAAFCMAINAGADTYYASPDGSGTGTADSPCSLTAGINKAINHPSSTLILKSGRYLLDEAIALTGAGYGLSPTIVRGETDNPQDVILDAQGKSEVMRVNQNVIVSGITMMNGSNKGFASGKYENRASGVRVGWTTGGGTFSVVSNCVITCCTNEFTSSTKVDDNEVCGVWEWASSGFRCHEQLGSVSLWRCSGLGQRRREELPDCG